MKKLIFPFCLLCLLCLFACKKQPTARKAPAAKSPATAQKKPSSGKPATGVPSNGVPANGVPSNGKSGNAPTAPTTPTQPESSAPAPAGLRLGAEQLADYLPDLQGKRVGMIVNHTSLVNKTHLVDTLLQLQVNIRKIFAPEHGFRGDAANGEHVANGVDTRTGLPIISLYGSNRKPKPEQIADLDVLIFDIQDVGARFYTYISTMHYVMEACAENGKQLIVLDRPNPNGDYVDGPVLDPKFRSFVGMHPIPVVHGLTVGELAMMINGEKWLEGGRQCALKVVKNGNYTHHTPYVVPVGPSPNLPNALSIRLYPSLCLFEGTDVSIGRGTNLPFQVIGAPNPKNGSYTFTPRTLPGAKNPPFEGQLCYGMNLTTDPTSATKKFTLSYLFDLYQKSEQKDKFFNPNNFFDKLAGTDQLRKQILSGMNETQIRASWQADLTAYQRIRARYLLYQD